MKKPLFSVIIPTRKINDFLILENLPSLEKQTFKNFEVIILPDKISWFSENVFDKPD